MLDFVTNLAKKKKSVMRTRRENDNNLIDNNDNPFWNQLTKAFGMNSTFWQFWRINISRPANSTKNHFFKNITEYRQKMGSSSYRLAVYDIIYSCMQQWSVVIEDYFPK